MQTFTTSALAAILPFLLMSGVSAHGYITSPQARVPGPALGAACGLQVQYQQTADINGNIQGELQVAESGFDPTKCHIFLCKGFQFADQPSSNVHSFSAGQVVPIHFNIRAPHDGVANVSIVDTASNSVISQLKNFPQFALTSRPAQPDESDFSVTIPSDLGGKCRTAGECVIQMFWDARSIDQTYESCIDFVVGGGSGGAAPGGGSGQSGSSAAASTTQPKLVSTTIATTKAQANSSKTSTTSVSTTEGMSSATSTKPTNGETLTVTAGTTTLVCKEDL